MKVYTTNYKNTFIEVAEDTKATSGTVPPSKRAKKTVAVLQYELIRNNPYRYTSDDILFKVFAYKNDLIESEFIESRQYYFSKGRPCLRTSPLAKIYGFGIHNDDDGKVAIFGMETKEYQQFVTNDKIKKTKAMRSKKQ